MSEEDLGNPPATPPAGDPPATPPAGGPPATPPAGDPPQAKWWESDTFSDDQRERLTANGLTVDDPLIAVQKLTDMEIAAQRKLSANPADLMRKPKEGQDVAEWLRENGETFGVPDAPDGYEIARPEDWPKDAPWDDKAEAGLRELAHKHGLSANAAQELVQFEAARMKALWDDAGQRQEAATAELMQNLDAEWGKQKPAKLAQARQAMAAVAEKAGLDADAQQVLADTLGEKSGHPTVMKVFAAIGEMMGDDSLGDLTTPGGFSTTPAEARAEIAAMQKPGHEYYETSNKARRGDLAAKEAMKDLQKKMAGLRRIADGG